MKNMKKTTLSICIVGLLVLSSYIAVGTRQNTAVSDTITMTVQFSEPTTTESNSFIQLSVAGTPTVSYQAGKPVLPVYRTKLTFPFGTKITNIQATPQDVHSMLLTKKIQPAPAPVLQSAYKTQTTLTLDETVYNTDALYPETWMSYYTGGGLTEQNERATFVILELYPLRYAPAADTLHYANSIDVTITYEESTLQPFQASADYKLVIIAPSQFSKDLEPLITHKTEKGIPTFLKTTEEIYDEFDGVDQPEQIKYFIKYAIENYNTTYVLLVGGLKSLIFGTPRDDLNQGSKTWNVPVRYTNLRDDGPVYDPGYISDLYYADIYDSVGNFSSWDSNNDGIFAKWAGISGKDIIDHYPDVILGRLPCRNKAEVKIMVNKIIKYESESTDPWYNTIIAVAGDSHDDTTGKNYNEGEVVTDKILTDFMSSYTPVTLYASNQVTDPAHTPIKKNIIKAISSGAGHLVFDGHGNPFSWNTHWPSYGDWTGGIQITSFPKFSNKDKLPVCVVGGCHSSQFNVTLLYTITDRDNSKHSWCYGLPTPECWSWWMVRKIGGGAIASIGNTGLGYGYVGGDEDLNGDGIAEPVCVEGLGGYLQTLFYKTIDQETDILGDAHSGALSKYMDTFPPMSQQIDSKTVQEWALIGDPTLKMGGYVSAQN